MSVGRKHWDPRRIPLLAIKLDAGHTTSGNPRRGWAIIDTISGDLVDFVDEGYRGSGALSDRGYSEVVLGPEFPTKPSVYRELLKIEASE